MNKIEKNDILININMKKINLYAKEMTENYSEKNKLKKCEGRSLWSTICGHCS